MRVRISCCALGWSRCSKNAATICVTMRLSTRCGLSRLSFSILSRQRSTTPVSFSCSCFALVRSRLSSSFSERSARPASAASWQSRCTLKSSSSLRFNSSESLRNDAHSRFLSKSSLSKWPASNSPDSCMDSSSPCNRWIMVCSDSLSCSCLETAAPASRTRASASCKRPSITAQPCSNCRNLETSAVSWCTSLARCRRSSDSELKLWCTCCHCAFIFDNSCTWSSISAFCWESSDKLWQVFRKLSNCVMRDPQRSFTVADSWRCTSFCRASSAQSTVRRARSPSSACAARWTSAS
mmetsp:Transcript_81555/g.215152  ORF Transcript_81555/g.215152 Transcript_81555/m.215152 type:complete len:296 (+) Transcript_81555:182-1069(+)